jgi:hypothetical protein
MKFVRVLALVGAAALALAGPAHAAMEPDNVAEEVARAAEECRALGGRPNTEAMLTVDDLNGDGGEDWIVDFAKLRCAGATNPFCGTGGCSLQIFLWSNGSTWKSAFDELVRSYRLTKTGGRRTLEVTMGGSACDKPNYQTCNMRYLVQRGGIVPAR